MFNHHFFTFALMFTVAGFSLAAANPSKADTKRVVVDLDLEELGLLDGSTQTLELEIRCSGATPHHQVRMEGDVLVVRTAPLADDSTAMLDVPSVSGVAVSFPTPRQTPRVIETTRVIPAKPVKLPEPELAPVLESTPTAPVPAPAPPVAPAPPAISAEEEVMAAMHAAMAQARVEGAARLEESQRTASTDSGWTTEVGSSSGGGWSTEVNGERVD